MVKSVLEGDFSVCSVSFLVLVGLTYSFLSFFSMLFFSLAQLLPQLSNVRDRIENPSSTLFCNAMLYPWFVSVIWYPIIVRLIVMLRYIVV